MARTWTFSASNYLKVNAAPARLNFNSPSGQGWTMACWLRLARNDANDMTVMSDWVGGGGGGGLLMRTVSGKIRIFTISTNGGNGREAIGVTTMSTGRWYHCAASWDGATRSVYLDGALDASDNDGFGQATPSDPLGWYFGVRSALTNPLDGDLCEMALWNTILSAPEIVGLARGASPLEVRRSPDTSVNLGQLQGYWPTFGSANGLADFSGNGNNLTLVGTLATANHAPVGPQVPQDFDAFDWPTSQSLVKTFEGLADASVKTVGGLARASTKTVEGVAAV